jgi:chromosomal replication initiator protein
MSYFIYPGLEEKHKIYCRLKRTTDDVATIIQITCEALEISMKDLISKKRNKDLVEARMIAVGLLLEVNANFGLKKLGSIFKKDHTTIIYYRDTHRDLVKFDKSFRIKNNLVKCYL